MTLPMVLNEILLKLIVGVCIFNPPECLKECLYAARVSSWLHMATDVVVEKLQFHVPLIFDDHVVKNHTTRHDVVQGSLVPKTSRTMNNGKSRLQNPKGSFNIFWPASCTFANSICFLKRAF
jgi:hypothetical protein